MKFLKDLRVLTVLLVAVLVALGLGYFIWQQYTRQHSAQTAAEQAFSAIEQRHMRQFKERVDTQTLAASIVEQAFNTTLVQGGNGQNALGESMMTLLKPALSSLLARQIEDYIASGTFETLDPSMPNLLAHLKTQIAGSNASFKLQGVTNEGPNTALAHVGLSRPALETSTTLDFGMTRTEKGWQVDSVRNLEAVLRQFLSLQQNLLAKQNQELIAKMNLMLPVQTARISRAPQQPEQDTQSPAPVLLTTAFENATNADVLAFEYIVHILAEDGTVLKSFALAEEAPIPSGQIIEQTRPLNIDPENEVEQLILTLPLEKLQVSVMPQRLELSDGKSFAVLTTEKE